MLNLTDAAVGKFKELLSWTVGSYVIRISTIAGY
jgi:hypothetical protein